MQLEQPQASPAQKRESAREQRKQELRRRAALRCRMQLCVEFCFPPHFYQRKMTIFAPHFTKKSPAALLKMRLPPALPWWPALRGQNRLPASRLQTCIIPVSHEGMSLTHPTKPDKSPTKPIRSSLDTPLGELSIGSSSEPLESQDEKS